MLKSRKELMIVDDDNAEYLAGYCVVCGDKGWIDEIKHKRGCLLADAAVTHVRMIACRRRVVLSGEDGRYWWQGPGGKEYGIKRCGKYFIMYECSSRKVIRDNARLKDIRKYIVDNQGIL